MYTNLITSLFVCFHMEENNKICTGRKDTERE